MRNLVSRAILFTVLGLMAHTTLAHARRYHGGEARFVSRDPAATPEEALYGYVGNRATRFTDPLGLKLTGDLTPRVLKVGESPKGEAIDRKSGGRTFVEWKRIKFPTWGCKDCADIDDPAYMKLVVKGPGLSMEIYSAVRNPKDPVWQRVEKDTGATHRDLVEHEQKRIDVYLKTHSQFELLIQWAKYGEAMGATKCCPEMFKALEAKAKWIMEATWLGQEQETWDYSPKAKLIRDSRALNGQKREVRKARAEFWKRYRRAVKCLRESK